MVKVKIIIREKGRFVKLPGRAPFRTPAEIKVSENKLRSVIQVLHSCGITNYEVDSTTKNIQGVVNLPGKKSKIDERLERMENLLLTLISKEPDEKDDSSEQITNRLSSIEHMLKKERKIVYKETANSTPVVEELEDQYIPGINVSEMKISGKTTEVVEKKSSKDVDDAASLLSSLTKNGGK